MATAEDQSNDRPLRAEPRQSLKDAFANVTARPVKLDMSKFPDAPQDVYVVTPLGAEIAAWEKSGIKYGRKGRIEVTTKPTHKAELIVRCITDAAGKKVWTTSEEDTKAVSRMPADLQNHLFSACRKAIGIDDEEEDDDEESEGN